jgi:hypothetical protein
LNLSNNRALAIHPFLFAVLPVLYLYSLDIDTLPVSIILLPLTVGLSFTAIALLLLGRFCDDSAKSAIYVSIFWIWCSSYASFHDIVSYYTSSFLIFRQRYSTFIWIVLFITCVIFIYRKKHISFKVNNYFNLVGIFLILCQIYLGAVNYLGHQSKIANIENHLKEIKTTNISLPKDSLPPIYYIILDSYTGGNELKDILHYDNSTFINYLQNKGFYVVSDSHSNYAWTALSMCATFNMQYLPFDKSSGNQGEGLRIKADIPYDWSVINNQLVKFLKNIGYDFVDISKYSSLGFYYRNMYANTFNINLLNMMIFSHSIAYNYLTPKLKQQDIFDQFQKLSAAINLNKPTFTYAHFLIPHDAYVFDQNGHPPSFSSVVSMSTYEKRLYLDQLIFTNTMVEKVVDTILTKSQKQPIIIIQGDHGAMPHLVRDRNEGRRLRMGILNAYYFPQGGSKVLYNSITPVNSFRLMLNYYFGQTLPLLKDESYFSSSVGSRDLIWMTPHLKREGKEPHAAVGYPSD